MLYRVFRAISPTSTLTTPCPSGNVCCVKSRENTETRSCRTPRWDNKRLLVGHLIICCAL
uniref:Uncharacterized protein n=1 Tax=Astyanax mexicanus TaxID=7994 RepID=A0A3B1JV79_ASTMX